MKKMSIIRATYFALWVAAGACGGRGAMPQDGVHSATLPAAAMHAEMPRSTYTFVNSIGANTHLNYFDTTYGKFQLLTNDLRSIGIRHLRDGVHLQNDDYNHAVYGRWSALSKMGIRFDAVIDPRSNLGPVSPALLKKIEDLTGGSVESFEGPNEMDISKIRDWAETDRRCQRELFAAAKTPGDPLPVIGPSLASAANGAQLGNISDLLDIGNLHPYPAGKSPSAVFPEQLQLAGEVSGNKEVFFTETGYHNALNDHRDQPPVSESAAAKYIPRLFLEDFMRGIPRTYLYEFFDEKPNPALDDEQMHWGLARADGSPKPAFTALKNLIDQLNGYAKPKRLRPLTLSLSEVPDSVHHLLLQDAEDRWYLILWNEVPSYDTAAQRQIANDPIPATVSLARRAARVTLFEPAQQAAPIRSDTDLRTIRVTIPDEPLVLRISF